MKQTKPIIHGRDHAAGGADPIPGGGGAGARQLGVAWAGPYPATSLTSVVWKIPLVDGASMTFDLTRLLFRLETPGGTTSTVRVEKSSGGAAFSGSTVETISLTAGSYEATDTTGLGSVASGDLLRIVWTAAGRAARGYLVALEGVEA